MWLIFYPIKCGGFLMSSHYVVRIWCVRDCSMYVYLFYYTTQVVLATDKATKHQYASKLEGTFKKMKWPYMKEWCKETCMWPSSHHVCLSLLTLTNINGSLNMFLLMVGCYFMQDIRGGVILCRISDPWELITVRRKNGSFVHRNIDLFERTHNLRAKSYSGLLTDTAHLKQICHTCLLTFHLVHPYPRLVVSM